MKSATFKLSSFLLVCFVLTALSAYKPANKKPVAGDSYNGFWIAKSGDNFIVMNEAVLPESALEKDSKGELKNIDKSSLRNSLRFSNERQVDGKEIEAHFFAVTKEGLDRNVRSVSPTSQKTGLYTLTLNDIKAAYLYCSTGYSPGWGGQATCLSGASMCMAWKWATGESVYIICNTSN